MDFIDDFIQEYKNSPCLWKADSLNYKNRSKRQEAYLRLIEVASKHGEHYNVERTKQKINNLRCAFRHQLKKYNELKSKGEKEEPYCPKRKYFESLMFLKDEEARDKRLKTDHHQQLSIETIQQHHHHQQQQQQHCSSSAISHQQHRLKPETRLTAAVVTATATLLAEQDPLTTSTTLSINSVGGTPGGVEILEAMDTRRMSVNGGGGGGGGGMSSVVDTLHVPNHLFNDICKEIHKDNGETDAEEEMSVLEERDGAGSGAGTTLILEKDNSNTVNISVISSDKGLSLCSQDIEEIAAMSTTSTPLRKEHSLHLQHQQHQHHHHHQQQQQQQQLYIMETSSSLSGLPTLPPASSIISNNMMTPKSHSIHGAKIRKRSSSFSSQLSNETEDNNNSMTLATPITVPAANDNSIVVPSTPPTPMSKPVKSSEISLDLDHLITLACKSIPAKSTTNNDHYNAFGDIVAHKLRTMDAKQSLYAEKIISDVLYLGQMKYLTTASIERITQMEPMVAVSTCSISTSPILNMNYSNNSNNSNAGSSNNTIITVNNNSSNHDNGNVSGSSGCPNTNSMKMNTSTTTTTDNNNGSNLNNSTDSTVNIINNNSNNSCGSNGSINHM